MICTQNTKAVELTIYSLVILKNHTLKITTIRLILSKLLTDQTSLRNKWVVLPFPQSAIISVWRSFLRLQPPKEANFLSSLFTFPSGTLVQAISLTMSSGQVSPHPFPWLRVWPDGHPSPRQAAVIGNCECHSNLRSYFLGRYSSIFIFLNWSQRGRESSSKSVMRENH